VALGIEAVNGIVTPPRCQGIRVICAELGRISAHLLGLGAFAMDVGAMTIFLWSFRERELLYDLVEEICGAIVILVRGRKELEGSLAEIREALPDLAGDADLEEIFIRATEDGKLR
jgi:Ni,Fe-hydrogenase III large subunit